MPINIEITVEDANNKAFIEVKDHFADYYAEISEEIRSALINRGYKVSGVSPSIQELVNQKSDTLPLIEELMKALRREHEPKYKFVYQKKGNEITITQKNPLLDVKTQPSLSVPAETDTLLLVMIKTHIAERKLFGNLSENSKFSVALELFEFKKAELAFKDFYEETKSDISKLSRAKGTIQRAFSRLPIKTLNASGTGL